MAFHPYPQLIPPVFNLGGFGPPHALTRASTWPWVDHPASGLERATNRPFRLAFATDPPHGLTSLHATDSQTHFSIGTPSPPTRGSDGLKAHGFRNYFTTLPGYFSPFPHGTRPLSVTYIYLDLPHGQGRFTRDSTRLVLLGDILPRPGIFSYGTITLYGHVFNHVHLTPDFITRQEAA